MSEPRTRGEHRLRPHVVWSNLILLVGLALLTSLCLGFPFSRAATGAFEAITGYGTVLLSIVFCFAAWLTFPTVVVNLDAETIRWKGRTHQLARITRAEVFTRGVYTILRLRSADGPAVALIVSGVPMRATKVASKILLARAVERSGIEGETDDVRGRSAWSLGSFKNSTWETFPTALSRSDTVQLLTGAPTVHMLENAPGAVAGFGGPRRQIWPERLAQMSTGLAAGWKIVGTCLMFFGAAFAALFAWAAIAGTRNGDPWFPVWLILFLASVGLFLVGLGWSRKER